MTRNMTPTCCRTPDNMRDAAPARVLMIQLPPCPVSARWTALKRKRRLLWHNDRRNAPVAAVAKALRGRDKLALAEFGLQLDDLPNGRVGKKIVVLVESTEHGKELLAWLPGWEMLDAIPAEIVDGYEPDDIDGEKPPAGYIATLVYAVRYGTKAGVLVRATGGRGRLALEVMPRLLFDFHDRHDVRAEMETLARMKDYQERGLQVIELAPPTRRQ